MKKETNLPCRQAGKSRLHFLVLKTWQNGVIVFSVIMYFFASPKKVPKNARLTKLLHP
jgi:hypothetical protein